MKESEINIFEKVQMQLESLHSEISALTKKSQNDALNKFKLKFVNQTIESANNVLGKKYKPFNEFNNFNEDDLPTNSDVTMILGQYLNCMEKLRRDNIYHDMVYWYWRVDGDNSQIRTSAPKTLKD